MKSREMYPRIQRSCGDLTQMPIRINAMIYNNMKKRIIIAEQHGPVKFIIRDGIPVDKSDDV